MSVQAPAAVVLIRPLHFAPNPETAADNAFQTADPTRSPVEIAAAAYEEVTRAADRLAAAGVAVHLFDDEDPTRNDSVFPNNWFSTHAGGRVAVYPMYAPNRRTERRADVVEMLKSQYRVQEVVDYSGLEHDGAYLEGTGAMVLDHVTRVAFTARSNRANPMVLERFCSQFGYEAMVFDACDELGTPIYHTNVMITIASDFALVGLDLIPDEARRRAVAESITEQGRTIIELSTQQVREFAGNAIELRTPGGRVLALSSRAAASLTDDQRAVIERSARLLPLDVPTIELAGGSVRCMVAGIHLTPRPVVVPVSEESVLGA
ncbi:MAG: arginine deiminase-related protein [Ornithinibacter sp.]